MMKDTRVGRRGTRVIPWGVVTMYCEYQRLSQPYDDVVGDNRGGGEGIVIIVPWSWSSVLSIVVDLNM